MKILVADYLLAVTSVRAQVFGTGGGYWELQQEAPEKLNEKADGIAYQLLDSPFTTHNGGRYVR